jgi:hypothetical protein
MHVQCIVIKFKICEFNKHSKNICICMHTKFCINPAIQSKSILKKNSMKTSIAYEHFHTKHSKIA